METVYSARWRGYKINWLKLSRWGGTKSINWKVPLRTVVQFSRGGRHGYFHELETGRDLERLRNPALTCNFHWHHCCYSLCSFVISQWQSACIFEPRIINKVLIFQRNQSWTLESMQRVQKMRQKIMRFGRRGSWNRPTKRWKWKRRKLKSILTLSRTWNLVHPLPVSIERREYD